MLESQETGVCFMLLLQTSACPFSYPWLSSVQSLSCVQLFATPWTAARQACPSITNSQSLPKLMSIELVIPSSYLILFCPLLLPPAIFPSIRVFSNASPIRPTDEQFLNKHWFNCASHTAATFLFMGWGPSSSFHVWS